MSRKGFIIDLNKCTGCSACVLACAIENAGILSEDWREITTYNERKVPGLPVFHYSIACNHCGLAPCKPACPAEAFSRDKATGAVVHNEEKCIGCRYCTWACPYDAPKYSIEKGVVEKCTFCLDRITNGEKPACALLCPTGALDYGPIGEENAPTQGFNHYGIEPAVNIIPHRLPSGPEVHYFPENIETVEKDIKKEDKRISLDEDWPQAVFTFIASLMMGYLAGSVIGEMALSPLLFLFAGIGAGVVSLLHLGKKGRAWRSVVHFKDSWLSREIVFFALFFLTGTWFVFSSRPEFVGSLSLLFGLAALFSIDRVYDVVRKGHKLKVHSADTLLTGLLFAGWFAGSEILVVIMLLVKLALFIYQQIQSKTLTDPLAVTRLTAGIVLPLLFFSFMDLSSSVFVLILLLAGEAIDRVKFYDQLIK